MQKVKNLKKSLSIFLAMLMVFCMTSIKVFAKGDLAMLTLDATNFTIVGQQGDRYTIEAKGLTSSYAPAALEEGSVTWKVSDNDKVSDDDEKIVEIEKEDKTHNTVTIKLGQKKGEAKLTAVYKNGKEGVTEVSSNIVVEDAPKGYVKNVTVTINDPKGEKTISNCKLKSLDLFNVEQFVENQNDKDVLKNNPSALHALIKALEKNEQTNGLTIKSEGSYIEEILGTKCQYNFVTGESKGWQYTVNDEKVNKAASIYQLEDGDEIVWDYGPVEFK